MTYTLQITDADVFQYLIYVNENHGRQCEGLFSSWAKIAYPDVREGRSSSQTVQLLDT